jgi:hypothetical protein
MKVQLGWTALVAAAWLQLLASPMFAQSFVAVVAGACHLGEGKGERYKSALDDAQHQCRIGTVKYHGGHAGSQYDTSCIDKPLSVTHAYRDSTKKCIAAATDPFCNRHKKVGLGHADTANAAVSNAEANCRGKGGTHCDYTTPGICAGPPNNTTGEAPPNIASDEAPPNTASDETSPNTGSDEGQKLVGPRCTVVQAFEIRDQKHWLKKGAQVIVDDNQSPDKWGQLAPYRVRINGAVDDGYKPVRFSDTYVVHIVRGNQRYLADPCPPPPPPHGQLGPA